MARQSEAAKLTVVAGRLGERPEPPPDLTEAEGEIWRATVASEAVDFFSTDALRELLKDYCRHKATAAAVTIQINQYDASGLMIPAVAAMFDRLTKIRDRETKAAGDKATKLRLTNQSRYTPKAAGTASKNSSIGQKPWEIAR